ncbi:MAG: coenzyme A pyrophosphatase [Geobacteraceae bacterium GWC2_58_44]|nr:MAG: coenzyme A pyrophosphatase [Geobacteraceae bacterium GWC2_58_44]HBG05406.1 CoA pyrophosphatase [Geobacter sp.]
MNIEQFEKFTDTLPPYPGIQGREKYFNSAVLVPFVFLNDEFHLLFQKRASSISQGSEICFPGGKHEPAIDHDFKCTAVRETAEELGIDKNDVKVFGQLDTIVAPMGAIVETYIGVLDKMVLDKIKLDRREVDAVFIIPISYFNTIELENYYVRVEIHPSVTDEAGNETVLLPSKELGLPDKYQRPWGGKKHRVLIYKTEHGVIWGITAEIIFEMLQKSIMRGQTA